MRGGMGEGRTDADKVIDSGENPLWKSEPDMTYYDSLYCNVRPLSSPPLPSPPLL